MSANRRRDAVRFHGPRLVGSAWKRADAASALCYQPSQPGANGKPVAAPDRLRETKAYQVLEAGCPVGGRVHCGGAITEPPEALPVLAPPSFLAPPLLAPPLRRSRPGASRQPPPGGATVRE